MLKKFEIKSLKKRVLVFSIALIVLFCAVICRLLYLQVFKGGFLQAKATDQWTRDLPITAQRGSIYDCNGSTLATSYTTYNIYVRAREIKDANEVAKTLSSKLGLNFNQTFEKVKNNSVSEVLIKLKVEKEIAMEILSCSYPGVYVTESSSRYYPYGNLLTQILGFTTIDNIGQAGLEAFYNNYLSGTNGYTLVQSDLQGKQLYNSLTQYVPSGDDIISSP